MARPKNKNKIAEELHSIRDTVESIWVAVVLALVLRAFMIEAFVIPTGSMAPRLVGEHWQLTCPACGQEYAFGLGKDAQGDARFDRSRPSALAGALCPNCTCPFPGTIQKRYTNGGDRVLVMKYLYRFADPQPWDVVVFRNPQNNRENYIKRLVGLPGETIEIVHGDIFVRNGDGDWRVRTKPPRVQEAMWQVIFDNDYQPSREVFDRYDRRAATPPRWRSAGPAWDMSGLDGRRLAFAGADEPSEVVLDAPRGAFLPHYGYNRRPERNGAFNEDRDICSDVRLAFVVVPEAADSAVSLMLTSFEHAFKAEVRADGTCRLLHSIGDGPPDNWTEWGRTDLPAMRPGSSHEVALTHADFKVTLWVDGQDVLASTTDQYDADIDWLRERLDASSTRPIQPPQVKITASGGPCQLLHVKVHRDVYYTSPMLQPIGSGPLWDFARRLEDTGLLPDRSLGWATTGNALKLRKFEDDPSLDQFLVFGDNSPQSLDGRAWTCASPTLRLWGKDGQTLNAYEDGAEPLYQLGTVPRYNLIGKAFFVYWSAGFRVPGLPRLPILPNVGKMRLIR